MIEDTIFPANFQGISDETIDAFYNSGYSFIPTGPDKMPQLNEWKLFQLERPDLTDINQWPFEYGVAIICGFVSGGIECIDIDQKNDPEGTIVNRFLSTVEQQRPDLFQKVYIESSPSGGAHILYKCSAVTGSRKLALNTMKRPIIETKGQGGYVVVFPSPGYDTKQGDITSLPQISPDDQRELFELALSFNQTPEIKKPSRAQKKGDSNTLERLKSSIQEAMDQGHDIASSYTDWIKLGHALARDFGENGRELFQMVSWDFDEGNHQYDLILKSIERDYHGIYGPVSVRTIFYMLIHEFGIYPSQNGRDKIELCEDLFLRKGVRYNEILGRNELPGGDPLTDRIVNDWYLDVRGKVTISKELFHDILNSKRIPAYDPLKEKFSELLYRQFQGSPLDEFLAHLKLKDWILSTDDTITAVDPKPFIKKWLLSIVASVYGHVSEMVLVLISKAQGTGKTEFFIRLLPDSIRDYFAVSSLEQAKDSDLMMCQKLIILDDEFRGKNKKDAAHIKAKTSQKVFSMRKAYGRHIEDFRRIAVLCGCTNEPHVINDSTGNRRTIPVTVISRDYQISDSIDRNDLWADITQQYFAAIDHGDTDPFKMNWQDYQDIQAISEDAQFVNDHRELIQRYFDLPGPGEGEHMSATEIIDHIVTSSETTIRLNAVRIGMEMNHLGFEPFRTRQKRGFMVKKL